MFEVFVRHPLENVLLEFLFVTFLDFFWDGIPPFHDSFRESIFSAPSFRIPGNQFTECGVPSATLFDVVVLLPSVG